MRDEVEKHRRQKERCDDIGQRRQDASLPLREKGRRVARTVAARWKFAERNGRRNFEDGKRQTDISAADSKRPKSVSTNGGAADVNNAAQAKTRICDAFDKCGRGLEGGAGDDGARKFIDDADIHSSESEEHIESLPPSPPARRSVNRQQNCGTILLTIISQLMRRFFLDPFSRLATAVSRPRARDAWASRDC